MLQRNGIETKILVRAWKHFLNTSQQMTFVFDWVIFSSLSFLLTVYARSEKTRCTFDKDRLHRVATVEYNSVRVAVRGSSLDSFPFGYKPWVVNLFELCPTILKDVPRKSDNYSCRHFYIQQYKIDSLLSLESQHVTYSWSHET